MKTTFTFCILLISSSLCKKLNFVNLPQYLIDDLMLTVTNAQLDIYQRYADTEMRLLKNDMYSKVIEVRRADGNTYPYDFPLLNTSEHVILRYVPAMDNEYYNLELAIEAPLIPEFINYTGTVYKREGKNPPFFFEQEYADNLNTVLDGKQDLEIKSLLAVYSNMLVGLSVLSSRHGKSYCVAKPEAFGFKNTDSPFVKRVAMHNFKMSAHKNGCYNYPMVSMHPELLLKRTSDPEILQAFSYVKRRCPESKSKIDIDTYSASITFLMMASRYIEPRQLEKYIETAINKLLASNLPVLMKTQLEEESPIKILKDDVKSYFSLDREKANSKIQEAYVNFNTILSFAVEQSKGDSMFKGVTNHVGLRINVEKFYKDNTANVEYCRNSDFFKKWCNISKTDDSVLSSVISTVGLFKDSIETYCADQLNERSESTKMSDDDDDDESHRRSDSGISTASSGSSMSQNSSPLSLSSQSSIDAKDQAINKVCDFYRTHIVDEGLKVNTLIAWIDKRQDFCSEDIQVIMPYDKFCEREENLHKLYWYNKLKDEVTRKESIDAYNYYLADLKANLVVAQKKAIAINMFEEIVMQYIKDQVMALHPSYRSGQVTVNPSEFDTCKNKSKSSGEASKVNVSDLLFFETANSLVGSLQKSILKFNFNKKLVSIEESKKEPLSVEMMAKNVIGSLIIFDYIQYIADNSQTHTTSVLKDLPITLNLPAMFAVKAASFAGMTTFLKSAGIPVAQSETLTYDKFRAHLLETHLKKPTDTATGNKINFCSIANSAINRATGNMEDHPEIHKKIIKYQTITVKTMLDYFKLFGRTLEEALRIPRDSKGYVVESQIQSMAADILRNNRESSSYGMNKVISNDKSQYQVFEQGGPKEDLDILLIMKYLDQYLARIASSTAVHASQILLI